MMSIAEGQTTIGSSPSTTSIGTALEVPTNFRKEFDMEIWKPIQDLPGYSVSNKGRVKKDSTGQIMVLGKNGGYCRITISKHVHRLVAEAFIEKPDDEKCWVDHIDGNRSNNDVDNLRWVTPSENACAYGYQSRIENKRKKYWRHILTVEKSCLTPDKPQQNILDVLTPKYYTTKCIRKIPQKREQILMHTIKKAGCSRKLKI